MCWLAAAWRADCQFCKNSCSYQNCVRLNVNAFAAFNDHSSFKRKLTAAIVVCCLTWVAVFENHPGFFSPSPSERLFFGLLNIFGSPLGVDVREGYCFSLSFVVVVRWRFLDISCASCANVRTWCYCGCGCYLVMVPWNTLRKVLLRAYRGSSKPFKITTFEINRKWIGTWGNWPRVLTKMKD